MVEIAVRRTLEGDLHEMARINAQVFLGDRNDEVGAEEWIRCWFRAYPLYQYWTAFVGDKVVGYVGWQIHGGFQRPEPVIELEQLGIHPDFQGEGVGPKLTAISRDEIMAWVFERNKRIESQVSLVVWAYANNLRAAQIYLRSFPEGPQGFCTMYGNRAQIMYRGRVPYVQPMARDA